MVACAEISFNISVLNVANWVGYKNREWLDQAGNGGNTGLERNILDKQNNKKVHRINDKEQKNTFQNVYNIVSTTDVQTLGFKYQTNSQLSGATREIGAVTNLTSYSIQFLNRSDTKLSDAIPMGTDKTKALLKLTQLNATDNSKYKNDSKKHPHEKTFELIASGKFIIQDLMKQVNHFS